MVLQSCSPPQSGANFGQRFFNWSLRGATLTVLGSAGLGLHFSLFGDAGTIDFSVQQVFSLSLLQILAGVAARARALIEDITAFEAGRGGTVWGLFHDWFPKPFRERTENVVALRAFLLNFKVLDNGTMEALLSAPAVQFHLVHCGSRLACVSGAW